MAPRSTCLAIIALLATPAAADTLDTALDKSSDSLFSPTPRSNMRELSPVRPDDTESPYTIDAGHFQLEADVAAMNFAGERELGLFEVNSRIGLLSWLDFQVIVQTYRQHWPEGAGESKAGTGDVTLRAKANLVGNDGGDFALGIMPYVTLPTASSGIGGSGGVAGGLILPIAVALPAGFHAGFMLEGDLVRDSQDAFMAGLVSATFGHDIVGSLSGFAEVVVSLNGDNDGNFDYGWNTGLIFGIGDDVQLDAGVRIVFPNSQEGVTPFVGVAFRH